MFRMRSFLFAVRTAVGVAASMAALPAPAQSEDEQIEQIVITGTRLERANLETMSPIVQLEAEAIEMTGLTRIEDVLQQIPQVSLYQNSGLSNASDGTATADLRVLGANRTLVLVDGRRLPIGSPRSDWFAADLNFIPSALVKRVDILTGGASAMYGSDAVAGVINFIMKDDLDGVHLDYLAAQYRHENSGRITSVLAEERGFNYATGASNDGDTSDLTLSLGTNIDEGRGNVTAYATYRDITAITQAQRDYSACALQTTQTGARECGGSDFNAAGSFYAPFYPPGYNVVGTDFVPWSSASLYNYAPPTYFQRPDERYTAGAFAHYDVSDRITLFTQLMYMDDRTVVQYAPALASYRGNIYCDENTFLSTQQIDALGCVAGNGDVAQNVVIRRRNVEGGPRGGDLQHSTYRGLFGARGDINETWSYEASYQYAEVDMDNEYDNLLNRARIRLALDPVLLNPNDPNSPVVCRATRDAGDTRCVPWNIWQTGGVTSVATDYLDERYSEDGSSDQTVFTAFARGNLGDYGMRSPWANDGIDVVIGYEHREENLVFTPGVTAQAVGAAVPPADGGYKVDDYFFEAGIPILQGRNLVKDLSVEVGYRYSDYNTDVTPDTYKIAASWSIDDQVMLRASVQHAVRAANIVELFAPMVRGFFPMLSDPCAGVVLAGGVSGSGVSGRGFTFAECARSGVSRAVWDAGGPESAPARTYNYVSGGNSNLNPEDSDTYSAGVVLRPQLLEGLTVAVDYYDIDIEDVVWFIDPETMLVQCIRNDVFCTNVHRGEEETLWLGEPGPTNGVEAPRVNAALFRVKGIDMEATYTFDIGGLGSMNLTNVFAWIDSWEMEQYPGAVVERCEGVYGGVCSPPTPEVRNRFTTAWTTPWNFSVQVTWRHTSGVDQVYTTTPVDIHDADYVDLGGTWTATDWLTARIGVNNLFDIDPPIIDTGAAFGNGNTIPGNYDHLGQYWFLGASMRF